MDEDIAALSLAVVISVTQRSLCINLKTTMKTNVTLQKKHSPNTRGLQNKWEKSTKTKKEQGKQNFKKHLTKTGGASVKILSHQEG